MMKMAHRGAMLHVARHLHTPDRKVIDLAGETGFDESSGGGNDGRGSRD